MKFYFRHLDLRVCQISSPMEKLEFFPLWWKIFHFQKLANKNFVMQNCMNWNILQRELFSEKSEIFPLFRFFRKFRKFIFLGLQVCQLSAKSKKLFWLHSSLSSSFIIIIIIIIVIVMKTRISSRLQLPIEGSPPQSRRTQERQSRQPGICGKLLLILSSS